MIQDDSNYYEYDDFNKLMRVRESNATGNVLADYYYDSEGTRVKMVEVFESGNVTTYYLGKEFVRVVNISGTFDTTYYYHGDSLVGSRDNDSLVSYYHPDHLGSTSVITNESGEVVEYTSYYPFGAILEGGESRYDYEGKETESLTGLTDFHFRPYDAELRLFIQPDSLLPNVYDPQQLNRYAFERGNPYRYVDPTGQSSSPYQDFLDVPSIIKEAIRIGHEYQKLIDKTNDPELKEYLRQRKREAVKNILSQNPVTGYLTGSGYRTSFNIISFGADTSSVDIALQQDTALVEKINAYYQQRNNNEDYYSMFDNLEIESIKRTDNKVVVKYACSNGVCLTRYIDTENVDEALKPDVPEDTDIDEDESFADAV